LNNEFDYIVCGSGSSGSVVAGRLASNPAVRVLLLEAGRDDDTELVMDPNQWMRIFGTPMDWGFHADPNAQLNGRAIPYSMGKVLWVRFYAFSRTAPRKSGPFGAAKATTYAIKIFLAR
jgi:choline dehydrogenase